MTETMTDVKSEKIEKTKQALDPTSVVLPDKYLAHYWHVLELTDDLATNNEKEEAKKYLMGKINENDMAPLYQKMCTTFNLPLDAALLSTLKEKNKSELDEINARLSDAEDNYGDVETKDAVLERAHFYCRIGDKEEAVKQYEQAHTRTVGIGGRLDIVLTLVRLGLFYDDSNLTKVNIQRAKEHLEKGGDWERRNKLKVYEGLHLMRCRQFKDASQLFLDSIATFTASELLDFETFIFYIVILSMLIVERPVMKKQVCDSSEVLQVISQNDDLRNFITSFYECNYSLFMKSLLPVSTCVKKDRNLTRHYLYFIRNMRLRAYAQFLEPFKSVTIESMANAFGVSKDFVEEEVASFIAGGNLGCRIDKVQGVFESNRPDEKNALYNQAIKQGDLLLNRIQKLSRVLDT